MLFWIAMSLLFGFLAGHEYTMRKVVKNAEDYRRMEFNGRLYKVEYAEPLAEYAKDGWEEL